MLKDHQARQKAIDPSQSFIVQAPAGSGKTELLTQRFLNLLCVVKEPEHIIALTFTRKAANEMRERILNTLQAVAKNIPPKSAHQQQTFALAQQALAQNIRQKWQLLEQPSRLRIFTIDALCQRICQAIPLQDKHIPYAKISDQPEKLYLEASKACLDYAISEKSLHQALKTLLQHVDNRQNHLLSLWTSLLTQREQWLAVLHHAKQQDKSQLEQALSFIENHELERFIKSIPKDSINELITLAHHVADIENNPQSERYLLKNWQQIEEVDRTIATALASLLLTSQNKLRKAFDHHVGVKKGSCEDTIRQDIKERSQTLLSKLAQQEDFLPALLRVKQIPEPFYHEQQWQVLQALLDLLPLLAAHLQLVFAQHNEVDFTAVTQQALDALGQDDQPTDLALYLDHQIHHLLVDEFQDTSIQQFELLTQLIQGWQPDEAKSLFVVGDPMQSIYRFRAAEVGLFIRAREHGIGPVKLTALELSANFRSTTTIVDWVNQHFQHIFPQSEDIEAGAISYHPSISAKGALPNSFINARHFESREEEAHALLKLVTQEMSHHPEDDIAILVRSRNQLREITAVLRHANIPFQGIEIDCLAQLDCIRDAYTLTKALLMPANRLAWLALLRSPWCGLKLDDLHALANHAPKQSIYWSMGQLSHIQTISDEGRQRAVFIYQVLHYALCQRFQKNLVDWLIETLQHLHLKHILSPEEQDDLEQYWQLVERHEQQGQIEDWQRFDEDLTRLFSKRVTPSKLQIMTIHKSKGLEFDSVILPSLSAKTSALKQPLIRWLRLPTEQGDIQLVSPLKAAHHEQCLVYNYLGRLEAEKEHYEQQRLLYVAATRAKKRLHLFDHQQKSTQGTFRHLLINQMFQEATSSLQTVKPTLESEKALPTLKRLPTTTYHALFTPPSTTKNTIAVSHDPHHTRITGIVTHVLLQWLCEHSIQTYEAIPWTYAAQHLKALGIANNALETCLTEIKTHLRKLFDDPIGQWIMATHPDAHNEHSWLVTGAYGSQTKIIDRTFVDQDKRWVIDFKTGLLSKNHLIQHRKQVDEYAKILKTFYPQAIHCGLYYLTCGHWETWTPIDA